MKNYFDSYYQNMLNDVIAACNTIAGNPCSKLQSDFESLKSEINGLSLEDGWQDSVGDAFGGVKSSCIAGLDTIIQSIGSDFSQSETIYKTLKDTLDKLKTANEEYKTIYNEKPNKDSSKYYDSQGKDNGKYQQDYDKWQDMVKQKETECENLQTEVTTQKGQLDGINGHTISTSLTASLPQQAESFANDFFNSVGIDGSTALDINASDYLNPANLSGYQLDFINEVIEGAISTYKKYGVLPSLTIAQAIQETGWGQHRIGNNIFGVKAKKSWTGKTKTVWTHEYVKGKKIRIQATFRDYDSVSESIEDHAKVLTLDRYKGVLAAKDYKEACRQVKAGGYATGPTYDKSLINLIEKYGLDQWDPK